MSDSKSIERPGKVAEIINEKGPMTAREMADRLGYGSRPLANRALKRATEAGMLMRCPRPSSTPGRHPYEYQTPPDGEEKTVKRCRECGWTEPDGACCGGCGLEYPPVAEAREVVA